MRKIIATAKMSVDGLMQQQPRAQLVFAFRSREKM
jgi:hypothetical protein